MAHIPPKRGDAPIEGDPITIEGKDNSIEIKLPLFFEVNTSMSIKLKGNEGEAKVLSKSVHEAGQNSFKSKIIRIELEDVERVGSVGWKFKPNRDGICKVKIIFEHPD